MDEKLSGLSDLSQVFDEVNKGEDGEGVLEARFSEFIQQLENLSQPQNVGMDSADGLVQKAAEAITTQFNDYAKRLETLTENKTNEFKDAVETVNTTLNKIRDLNQSIRKSQIFGGEALTQRDERNLLIDELSEKIGIHVTYEMEDLGDGLEVEKLVIKTSGEPEHTLVDGLYSAQLSLLNETNFDLGITKLFNAKGKEDPANVNETLATAVGVSEATAANPASSFDEATANALAKQMNEDQEFYLNGEDPTKAYYFRAIYEEPASEGEAGTWRVARYDTDYSSKIADRAVKAELTPTNTVVATESVTKIKDTELAGGLQAMRELLTEEGEYASADDLVRDPEAGTKRGIPYYRQALDTLAREFAEQLNKANQLSDETIYQWKYETDESGNYLNAEGQAATDASEYVIQFLDQNGAVTTDPKKYALKKEYEYYNGGPLFSNSGRTNDTTDINAANISVAYDWSHGSTRVLRSTEPDAPSLKQDNIDHIITLMTSKQTFTFGTSSEGTSYFEGTFQDMLTESIAGTLAKDQNITQAMLNNYSVTKDELYVERDSVMGVDLNDEAMNMMMFQKAYSAACRLMTTYDGLLDKLINGTAV